MSRPARQLPTINQKPKANENRPAACQSNSKAPCSACDDHKVLYQEAKFGARCQAICTKLDDVQYMLDPRNQCRRPASVTAEKYISGSENADDEDDSDNDEDDDDDKDDEKKEKNEKQEKKEKYDLPADRLQGYEYCDEHAIVYSKFLPLLSYTVDYTVQDEICMEMLKYYRKMARKEDVRKLHPDAKLYATISDYEKYHGTKDFSSSTKLMFDLVNSDPRHWISVRLRHVPGMYSSTFEFIDVKTNLLILHINSSLPLPLIIHLYTRHTTYFFLYKRIGTRSDDYLGNDRESYIEPIFRNRLLARALFVSHWPPIERSLTGKEHETFEPGASEYGTTTNFWIRYPLTGRPVTLMPSMCRVDQKGKKTCSAGDLLFPVVRFQNLYYSNEKDNKEEKVRKYCGKFYFYDPESEIVMNLGKCLISASKPHAFYQLASALLNEKTNNKRAHQVYRDVVEQSLINEDDKRRFLQIEEGWEWNNKNKIKHAEFNVLPDVTNYNPDADGEGSINQVYGTKAAVKFYYSLLAKEADVKVIESLYATPLWPSTDSDLKLFEVGVHDHYDQIICNLARALQYDTILLQHEIGQSRSVTEVLDVRENSYEFLYRTPPRSVDQPWFPQSKTSQFPTIWFTSYGFIQQH